MLGLPHSDAAAAPVAMSTATLVRQTFHDFSCLILFKALNWALGTPFDGIPQPELVCIRLSCWCKQFTSYSS